MESCNICVDACPINVLSIKDEKKCVRLYPENFQFLIAEKCNNCGKCILICPINKIGIERVYEYKEELKKDCTICFFCRGKPLCICTENNRESLYQFYISLFYYITKSLQRIFKQT